MLRRRQHGTSDHRVLPRHLSQAAVRSVPGRDRAEARVIRSSDEKARRDGGIARSVTVPAPLDRAGVAVSYRPISSREGMSIAFVFPGQGSQAVGMGKALADAFAPARGVFEEVNAALGEKLTRIMWEGPAETLTLTENAQPALMAVSLAAMRVLEAHAGVNLARDARFV